MSFELHFRNINGCALSGNIAIFFQIRLDPEIRPTFWREPEPKSGLRPKSGSALITVIVENIDLWFYQKF